MDADQAAHGPAIHYQAALERRELVIQYCTMCDRHIHYPRFACPHCSARSLEWRHASGRGKIYAFTLLPQRDASFRNTALVDLDEGVRLVSTIRTESPEALCIGQAVSAAFEKSDPVMILVFYPVQA